jgi:ankyrin repeat protein
MKQKGARLHLTDGSILQIDCVKALIAAKCNIGAGAMDDMNALHFAAQKGHLEVCRLLLNEGVPV